MQTKRVEETQNLLPTVIKKPIKEKYIYSTVAKHKYVGKSVVMPRSRACGMQHLRSKFWANSLTTTEAKNTTRQTTIMTPKKTIPDPND